MPTVTFLPADRLIRVPAPATEITVQDLVDQIADFLDEPQNLNIEWFAEWAGKTSLGGSPEVFSEIVLILTDDWRVEFEARPGPDYVSCVVRGGTLVAANTFDNNPIAPTAFTQVQIRQSISGTLLSAEEMRKLLMNKTVTDPDTGLMTVYDDDDVTPFLQAEIFEDADGAVPYRRDGIERRERFE